MIRMTERMAHGAVRCLMGLAMVALFVMMALTFADVLLRSFANAPIPGAAELTEIFLAALVFAALPATSLYGRHISVDLFDVWLMPKLRGGLANLIFAGLLCWPVLKCWESGVRTLGYGEVTLYLRIPVGWIILGIATGLALAACVMALRGIALIFLPRSGLTRDIDNATQQGSLN